MAIIDKFIKWKADGVSTAILTTRANGLLAGGYINQQEYDEIIAVINAI